MEIRHNATGAINKDYTLVQLSGDATTYTNIGIASASEAQTGTSDTQLVTPKSMATVVGAPMSAAFTVGTEAGNVIKVSIQLKDAAGADLAVRASLFGYLSDDANGDSVCATAPDGHVAIATDGLAMHLITDKAFQLTSESDGDIDINITDSGTPTFYLILVLPTGKLAASGAITFA